MQRYSAGICFILISFFLSSCSGPQIQSSAVESVTERGEIEITDQQPSLPEGMQNCNLSSAAMDSSDRLWLVFGSEFYRKEADGFRKVRLFYVNKKKKHELSALSVTGNKRGELFLFSEDRDAGKFRLFKLEGDNPVLVEGYNESKDQFMADSTGKLWNWNETGVWCEGKKIIHSLDYNMPYTRFTFFEGLQGRMWIRGPNIVEKNYVVGNHLFLVENGKLYYFDSRGKGIRDVDNIFEIVPGELVLSRNWGGESAVISFSLKDGELKFEKKDLYPWLSRVSLGEFVKADNRLFARFGNAASEKTGYVSGLAEIKDGKAEFLTLELDKFYKQYDGCSYSSLFVSSKGTLFAGTEGNGIAAFYKESGFKKRGPQDGSGMTNVDMILEDSKGTVYFINFGDCADLSDSIFELPMGAESYFNGEKAQFKQDYARTGPVKDREGNIWWISDKGKSGTVVCWDGQKEEDVLALEDISKQVDGKAKEANLQTLGVDTLGRVWVYYVNWQGGQEAIPYIYDPKTKTGKFSNIEKAYRECAVIKGFHIELSDYKHRVYFFYDGKVMYLNDGKGPHIKSKPYGVDYEYAKTFTGESWKISKPKLNGKLAYFSGPLYSTRDGDYYLRVENKKSGMYSSEAVSAILKDGKFVVVPNLVKDFQTEAELAVGKSTYDTLGVIDNSNVYPCFGKYNGANIVLSNGVFLMSKNSENFELKGVPKPEIHDRDFVVESDKKGNLVLCYGRSYCMNMVIFPKGLGSFLKQTQSKYSRSRSRGIKKPVRVIPESVKPAKTVEPAPVSPLVLFEMLMGEDQIKVKQAENGFLSSGEKGKTFLKEKLNNPGIDETLRFKIEALLSRME